MLTKYKLHLYDMCLKGWTSLYEMPLYIHFGMVTSNLIVHLDMLKYNLIFNIINLILWLQKAPGGT